jgi:hypothetical protein
MLAVGLNCREWKTRCQRPWTSPGQTRLRWPPSAPGFKGCPAAQRWIAICPIAGLPAQSSRSVIGRVKRQLVAFATSRAHADLAATLAASSPSDRKLAKAAAAAIETLRGMPPPQPLIGDAVERWLPVRLVGALRAAGIRTLADLTLRVPRRRRWWVGLPGLGPAGARHIEDFFAQHPALTERARTLITVNLAQELLPWERLVVPEESMAHGVPSERRVPAVRSTPATTTRP